MLYVTPYNNTTETTLITKNTKKNNTSTSYIPTTTKCQTYILNISTLLSQEYTEHNYPNLRYTTTSYLQRIRYFYLMNQYTCNTLYICSPRKCLTILLHSFIWYVRSFKIRSFVHSYRSFVRSFIRSFKTSRLTRALEDFIIVIFLIRKYESDQL